MILHPCWPPQLIREFITNGWATYEDHLQTSLNFGKIPINHTVNTHTCLAERSQLLLMTTSELPGAC